MQIGCKRHVRTNSKWALCPGRRLFAACSKENTRSKDPGWAEDETKLNKITSLISELSYGLNWCYKPKFFDSAALDHIDRFGSFHFSSSVWSCSGYLTVWIICPLELEARVWRFCSPEAWEHRGEIWSYEEENSSIVPSCFRQFHLNQYKGALQHDNQNPAPWMVDGAT